MIKLTVQFYADDLRFNQLITHFALEDFRLGADSPSLPIV